MTISTVLVVNAGSSSLKLHLVDPEAGSAVAEALVERLGTDEAAVRARAGSAHREVTGRLADVGAALRRCLELLAELGVDLAARPPAAVGHRVVHGGPWLTGPVVVDDEVIARIQQASALAPLHNPGNLAGIRCATELLPGVRQVAVLDTAFFADLPEAAATYALDVEVAREHHVRRYGFHGTSHEYVSGQVPQLLGRPADGLRQVVLHLGNGASASAVLGGRAVDTSMGLTPLEGLVMGTRGGDLDPGVVLHLMRVGGMDLDGVDDLLSRRSGLRGLAGSNDLRDVVRAADAGDRRAVLALEVMAHRLRKYVGAYAAVLGGLDALTFTAGVGENSARVRAAAVAGLEHLGVRLDRARNEAPDRGARVVSADDSAVAVLVVPTDEELMIARHALATV